MFNKDTPKHETCVPCVGRASARHGQLKSALRHAILVGCGRCFTLTQTQGKVMVTKPPKPAPAKVAAKKKTAKPATVHPDPTQVHLKASSATKPKFTVEQRHHYVSVAAFYIAERRGFTLGNPADDWLAAEAEVERLLASGHFPA